MQDDDDLSSEVTIVIVTSPTLSNPSTEMIDRCLLGVLRSFSALKHCSIIIACDGVEVVENPRRAHSRRIFGKCSAGQFERYKDYCKILGSRHWLKVDVQTEWQGFALALKSALDQVATPLVMVLPHDYELSPKALANINLSTMLAAMREDGIAYIGLPNPRVTKFRSRHAQALKDIPARKISVRKPMKGRESKATLQPLAMWKENPHFATVSAYKSIVYSEGRRYKRGQFIEDTLGQDMVLAMKEKGERAFLSTYILSLPSPCSFHMDGPRYLPISDRVDRNYAVQEFEARAAKQAAEFVMERNRTMDQTEIS